MLMKTWTRAAIDSDKERFMWIERYATPGLAYIDDVWDMFKAGSDGEFSAAFYGDELGGIGKLTRLFDGYAWLETLRVHPDYQGKGLGKAIYERYMEQMTDMKLSAVGMYTNYDNIVSRSLAEKYGLSVAARFSEYNAGEIQADKSPFDGLTLVTPEHSETLLSERFNKIRGFLVLNRTFYPVKQGLLKKLAINKWLYTHEHGIIVMGCRFQPKKALHIAFMDGNRDKLLQLAKAHAVNIGANMVSAMRAYDDEFENELFLKNGFTKNNTDYITLWKGLDEAGGK